MPNLSRVDQVKRAIDRACSLHKSTGVRRTGLDRALGPELRALWGVGGSDSPDRVRAKAVLQLERVFAGLDPVVAAVARGWFNTSLDPAWWELNLTGRKRRLREGLDLSQRTLERRFGDEAQPALIASLRAGPAPVPPADVLARLDAERRAVAGDPPDDGADERIGRFREPVPPLEQALRFAREEPLHGLRDREGRPVVLDAGGHGAWMPVFSTRARLREYLLANPAFDGFAFTSTGPKLAAELTARHPGTGLAVNPVADPEGNLGRTFTLLPEQVWELLPIRRSPGENRAG
ncbi:hypothetical protein Amir_0232 [Actinosynnema mirum DSM 43827]|uniref:SseB protein N-terminal domain-containing protein n=1 Tax=Actinosynnema mirum (strain ATCC 29888 / DSM 43827 / JCM 3225 / NBRC 14064 / NCIMB 13271 / NRRL B-12336 / IMRU 3971 / 101) TaxID=446462 RepID=C6WF69_ACTMD|nr:hypothetical protein Amir_0232 [Actinosynnema mirum DSM 43827]